MREEYLPTTDLGKTLWMDNFAEKLPNHAAVLGLTVAQTDAVEADAKNFAAMVTYQNNLKEYGVQVTAFKNVLRDGGLLGALPAPPVFSTPDPLVAGIFTRTAQLVQTIKNHAGYTQAIGEDLGIIGTEIIPDYNSLQPILKYELQSGKPNLIWKKGIASGIKFKVDRGTGTFEFLATDTIPDFLDKHPLPPLGQTAIWRYVAIYMHDDEEVGDWSPVLDVTVTGQP